MADDPERSEPSGMFTHQPLPYYVRLRVTDNDDAAPRMNEYRLVAYSVMEAMQQALLQAGGNELDGVKYRVDLIEPDLGAYALLFMKSVIGMPARNTDA